MKFHCKNTWNYGTPLKKKAAASAPYYLINGPYILRKGANNGGYP